MGTARLRVPFFHISDIFHMLNELENIICDSIPSCSGSWSHSSKMPLFFTAIKVILKKKKRMLFLDWSSGMIMFSV